MIHTFFVVVLISIIKDGKIFYFQEKNFEFADKNIESVEIEYDMLTNVVRKF